MVKIAEFMDRALRLDEDKEDEAKMAAFRAGMEEIKAEVTELEAQVTKARERLETNRSQRTELQELLRQGRLDLETLDGELQTALPGRLVRPATTGRPA